MEYPNLVLVKGKEREERDGMGYQSSPSQSRKVLPPETGLRPPIPPKENFDPKITNFVSGCFDFPVKFKYNFKLYLQIPTRIMCVCVI